MAKALSEIPTGKTAVRRKSFNANNVSAPANVILNLLFILLTIACFFPLLLVISVSFTDEKSILESGYNLIPHVFTLDAYDYLFKDGDKILRGYGISMLVTVIGTALSLLFSSMFSYPLSRRDLPYRNFMSFFIFFTMLFSGGLVPWYLVYSNAGLKNTLFALIIPLLISPFNLIIMRIFFTNTIPSALIESAKIDGASEWRIYSRIIMPLSLPVLATIGLFQTLRYWNDWFHSMVFISNNKMISLQFLMYKVITEVQYLNSGIVDANVASTELARIPTETVRMAMAIIGIGPIILVYPFLQKYFVKGLTIGAVKG
ncbi:MAG: sugar transporter permease [Paenibacillaceae bacterium]|nr:sugar transporter permease [Paenibacillaceae bacterium]